MQQGLPDWIAEFCTTEPVPQLVLIAFAEAELLVMIDRHVHSPDIRCMLTKPSVRSHHERPASNPSQKQCTIPDGTAPHPRLQNHPIIEKVEKPVDDAGGSDMSGEDDVGRIV